jgi:hypothetical protein
MQDRGQNAFNSTHSTQRIQLNAFNSKLLSRTAGEGASARKRGRVRVGLGG